MDRQTPTRTRLTRVLGALSIVAGSLLGGLVATADAADPGFAPEGTNTYSTEGTLSPKCPNALAGTPGSDPAEKVLNAALNTADSFDPGGTVHYSYIDNPNSSSHNFELQDCVVGYPASKFTDSDFDPTTGVLTNASKQDLTSDATELDAATLSGVTNSTDAITFSWTSPSGIEPGTWVCNFARDVSTGHGGGGNRKVSPTCFQVTGPTSVPKPTITPTVVCGPANDTVVIPDTDGVTYKNGDTVVNGETLTIPGGGLTIVATADDDYVLADPDPDTTTWTFTFSDANTACDPTVVSKPTITPTAVCGPDNDTVVIPSTTGVTYKNGATVVNGQTLTVPNGGLTIVATADDGYELDTPDADATTWTFTFSDANVACSQDPPPSGGSTPTATPAEPTYTEGGGCLSLDTYVIPTATGVVYQIDGQTVAAGAYDLDEGDSVTIVAVAQPGFALASGATSSWTFVGSDVPDCPVPVQEPAVGGGATVEPEPEVIEPAPAPVLAFTPEPEAAAKPVLAFTGARVDTTLVAALVLLGLGVFLVAISKRQAAPVR